MNDGVWKDNKRDVDTNFTTHSTESEGKRKRVKRLGQSEEPDFKSYILSNDELTKSGKGSKGGKRGHNSHKTINKDEMTKSGKGSKGGSYSYNTVDGGISYAKSGKNYSSKSKTGRSAKSGKGSYLMSGLTISSGINRKRTREHSEK